MHDDQSDVEFLSALAMSLQKEYHLNPEKTFVTGFSNGGYMSYTLMCQAGDVFNAAAPVAGLIDEKVFQSCAPGGPKPLLHIHGTADWMVPITGNRDKNGIKSNSPGAQELVKYFADLNDAVTTEMVKVSNNTTLTIYKPKNDGAEQRFVTTGLRTTIISGLVVTRVAKRSRMYPVLMRRSLSGRFSPDFNPNPFSDVSGIMQRLLIVVACFLAASCSSPVIKASSGDPQPVVVHLAGVGQQAPFPGRRHSRN